MVFAPLESALREPPVSLWTTALAFVSGVTLVIVGIVAQKGE
jgi:hypothetical protein